MAKVTVQKIADYLGTSKFAVSRALNGKPGVSEKTRAEIIRTAEEFGYVVKPKRSKRLQGIEIIYHDPDVAHRELWVEVQAGAQEEGARLGFETAVRWTDDRSVIERLASSSAGFILIGPHDMELLNTARATNLPCVRIGSLPLLDPMDQVDSTDDEGARVVADFLLELGHRHFVYVQGKPGYRGRITRLHAFKEVIDHTSGTSLEELTFPEDNAADDFRSAMLALVKRGPAPTAFFCGSDGVAVTVISELLRLGVRVPEDVSVVGHADYAIATQVVPQLTTVRVPHRAMGMAAVRLLLSRIGAFGPLNDMPPHRIVLVDELIVRQSTARAPKRSWAARLREAPVAV